MLVLSGKAYLLQVTKENTSSAMSTKINKGEWRCPPTHITLTRESYSSPTPSSNHGREYGGHIPLAETYFIPKVFLPKQTTGHAPWVSVTPPNYSRSSGWRIGYWDIPCMERPFRDGIWLFAMCEPGNESWSTSLTTLPLCRKHITLKSEETMALMQ